MLNFVSLYKTQSSQDIWHVISGNLSADFEGYSKLRIKQTGKEI
jgi:hypothetical protein